MTGPFETGAPYNFYLEATAAADILAAPGTGYTYEISSIHLVGLVAEASKIANVRDGASGNKIAELLLTTVGTQQHYTFPDPYRLTENTALRFASDGSTGKARVVGVARKITIP